MYLKLHVVTAYTAFTCKGLSRYGPFNVRIFTGDQSHLSTRLSTFQNIEL